MEIWKILAAFVSFNLTFYLSLCLNFIATFFLNRNVGAPFLGIWKVNFKRGFTLLLICVKMMLLVLTKKVPNRGFLKTEIYELSLF